VGVTRGRRPAALAVLAALSLFAAGPPATGSPDERFGDANDLARAGDYLGAIAAYHELASSGHESASLYWNWAQAASARGSQGEALWALLRARELDPGDRAVRRDVERLREQLNLDPAEIAPEPMAAAGRLARRFRLDLVAAALLALSLAAHALARVWPERGWPGPLAGLALALGLVAAAGPAAGAFARPTGTVVRRGAPLLDAASPTAEPMGSLREGEVVPILETSGAWLRVEDASGARGWAHGADVRRIDVAPASWPDRTAWLSRLEHEIRPSALGCALEPNRVAVDPEHRGRNARSFRRPLIPRRVGRLGRKTPAQDMRQRGRGRVSSAGRSRVSGGGRRRS